MKIHRFIGTFSFAADTLVLTDQDLVHQITKVLRLSPGNQVVLSDGKGNEVVCVISTMEKKVVHVNVLERKKNANEPDRAVTLYCALLKRENFEWVVQKATEIGVKEIIPLMTRRTVKLQVKLDRLSKIAQEAAEQSGRAFVPLIHEPLAMEAAIGHAAKNEMNLFFALSIESLDTKKFLPKAQKTIGVFIGPEGGWDDEEVQAAKKAGFEMSSLGKLTLRAETAAVVATYLATQNLP